MPNAPLRIVAIELGCRVRTMLIQLCPLDLFIVTWPVLLNLEGGSLFVLSSLADSLVLYTNS